MQFESLYSIFHQLQRSIQNVFTCTFDTIHYYQTQKSLKKVMYQLSSPKEELLKLILAFVKSLLFAGGFAALARRNLCFFSQHSQYKKYSKFLSGFLAGVTLNFEPLGRQSEIALYTLNKSMEVTYNMAIRRKFPFRLPKGECILNAIAFAILSFSYINNSEVFRDNYRKIMGLLLENV